MVLVSLTHPGVYERLSHVLTGVLLGAREQVLELEASVRRTTPDEWYEHVFREERQTFPFRAGDGSRSMDSHRYHYRLPGRFGREKACFCSCFGRNSSSIVSAEISDGFDASSYPHH